MDRVTFLGTGDSLGVPRVYCDCAVCTEARLTGFNRRLRSSVLLEAGGERLLIDCGPDWAVQMERLGMRETEQVFLTHPHFDHFGGLPEWADSCRWTGRKGRLYAMPDVIGAVRERFPWVEGNLIYAAYEAGMSFGGWAIETQRVCHGKNGFSYALRFSKDGYRWVYCPDSINLQGDEKRFLTGLDLLILGTSYYREEFDFQTRSVYDMVEAVELLGEVKPGSAVFTHMSHGVDIREAYPLPANVSLAEAGMSLELAARR
jgi:phosphoribosyl 1,2-cyclic phosphate phosphodiesterase